MRFASFLASTPVAAVVVLLAGSVRAQDRTTEAGEAAITNPNIECSDYTYTPVDSQAAKFPNNWETATIVASDAAGLAKWNAIKGSIPTNITARGTTAGDFSGVNYPSSDPDCWWTYNKCTTPKLAGLHPDTVNMPEPLTLGYGFDDGPNCSHNAFYEFLSEQKQKATMFYIGSNVQNHPLEAQRAVADGHEICVHTWSHPYMTSVSSEGVFAELYYTLEMIKLATGVTPTCWRPPYGDIDDRVRAVGAALGLRAILWEYDSNDWMVGDTSTTPAQVDANYEHLITLAGNGTFATQGTIILTHEINNYTMQEAINFYPKLKAVFTLVPVGVGYNITQPYIETNYTQPTFAQYTGGTTTTNASASATASGSLSASSKPAPTTTPGADSTQGSGAASLSAAGCVAAASALLGGLALLL
ncbi:carbohydrate esterase family 4 protein [Athelia psychrophila]|uniref:chitin deacetylase n=1 Tax=Athelia psychrophila TaxID=1759441 RepID=A0A166E9N7_9AGAM|nr:carbohydrate esterase family 4 protein [Fibularhizoctonia sp. CBS 109695]